jgi:3-methylcrotonyl-CoA carboxylase alpha subunit
MIAKLVVHSQDRTAALSALSAALSETKIAGSTVNTAFLAALAADESFAAGDVDTGLIARKQDALTAAREPSQRSVALAALTVSGVRQPGSADPWESLNGYAHFHPLSRQVRLVRGEEEIPARIVAQADGRFEVSAAGGAVVLDAPAGTGDKVALWPGHVTVFEGTAAHSFRVPDPEMEAEGAAGDSLRAPMPGLVKIVRVAAGSKVTKGQPLLVLEAMKMEHTIAAPHDGVIAEIAVEGAQVSDGTVLVRFEE